MSTGNRGPELTDSLFIYYNSNIYTNHSADFLDWTGQLQALIRFCMEKLSPANLYNLRLVGMKNRYYRLRQAALYLEKFGYIQRTGRTNASGEQYEFAITEKGRLALERFGGE